MKEKLRKLYADSLFRNSFYLMLNTGIQAVFGFFFWLIAAHIYNATDVGLATSLISAASLTAVFSMLGFNNVIVRFLPTSQRKNEQLSTAFTLSAVASILAAVIFLLWAVSTRSPIIQASHLVFLTILFIIYVFVVTINSLVESAFIAYRNTLYILIKNLVLSALKLALIFFVVRLGYIGIVSSTVAATLVALLLGYFWLMSRFSYRPTIAIDKETIHETKNFAMGNYFGTLFGVLPSMTLVLIVVSRLSAQDAAFFYIPSMIITVLNVIPSSTAQSLFAEVSHDEAGLIKYFKNSLKHLFALLIPAVIAIWILGGYVLHFFGPGYAAAGTEPLQILALAGLIAAANYLGDTLLNIKKMSTMYVVMNALNSIAIVVPAYIVAPHGLVAIAWAALFGQVLTAAIYIVMNWGLLVGLREV
jgi:O-antigen/teichoic acid export membrane protein